jgi:hypothetical protein
MKKHTTFTLRSSPISHRAFSKHGIALVLTLAILAIVTLMVVAFAVSMRVENMASRNFNGLIAARELANAAVDNAVATIREATPARNSPPLTWVTFPGHVWGFDASGVLQNKPLYSSPLSSDTVNLNANSSIVAQNNVEFMTPPVINAGWVYVGQNPYIAPGAGNPLIGRYAFWVDDEASKVNINQAWTRPNASVPADAFAYGDARGDTSEVDLNALLPGLNIAPLIQAQRITPAPYATIQEIVRADLSVPSTAYNDFLANESYLTTFSDDAANSAPDNDVFGRKRMSLTYAALNTVQNITGVGGDGAYARLSDKNLMTVCAVPGAVNAFADTAKYGPIGLEQIIANIIAYQFDPQVTGTGPPDGGGDPPSYLGLARTPYVNEVKIVYTDMGTDPPTMSRMVSIELFYPYTADGTGTYTPGPDVIVLNNLPAVGALGTFQSSFFTSTIIQVLASTTFSATTPYQVVTSYQVEPFLSYPANPLYPPTPPKYLISPVTITAAPAITVNYYRGSSPVAGYRLNCAQVPLQTITYNVAGPPSPAAPVWHGAEVNDPCVNMNTAFWTPYNTSTSVGTLGNQNNAYHQTADPTLPSKALPSKMHIRGAAMKSIGELGFIHTPSPWTYLRLQPQTDNPAIPDWAMLDLFTVGGATAGRININSAIDAYPSFTPARRLVPLEALLNNAASWLASPATVAQSIYDGTYSSSGNGNDIFGNKQAFDTIGEICEIQGLADSTSLSEAAKEAAIRRIANLITVRSNTFTIWAIAQSIKDVNKNGLYEPPTTGQDFISGEVRAQAIVERYEDTTVPPTAIKFRTKYFRYINQ